MKSFIPITFVIASLLAITSLAQYSYIPGVYTAYDENRAKFTTLEIMESVKEKRVKLGLSNPYFTSSGELADSGDDEGLNGPINYALGFVYGLQYTSDKPGQCYYTLSTSISNTQLILYITTYFYNPTLWADFGIAVSSQARLYGLTFVNCEISKFINTIT